MKKTITLLLSAMMSWYPMQAPAQQKAVENELKKYTPWLTEIVQDEYKKEKPVKLIIKDGIDSTYENKIIKVGKEKTTNIHLGIGYMLSDWIDDSYYDIDKFNLPTRTEKSEFLSQSLPDDYLEKIKTETQLRSIDTLMDIYSQKNQEFAILFDRVDKLKLSLKKLDPSVKNKYIKLTKKVDQELDLWKSKVNNMYRKIISSLDIKDKKLQLNTLDLIYQNNADYMNKNIAKLYKTIRNYDLAIQNAKFTDKTEKLVFKNMDVHKYDYKNIKSFYDKNIQKYKTNSFMPVAYGKLVNNFTKRDVFATKFNSLMNSHKGSSTLYRIELNKKDLIFFTKFIYEGKLMFEKAIYKNMEDKRLYDKGKIDRIEELKYNNNFKIKGKIPIE